MLTECGWRLKCTSQMRATFACKVMCKVTGGDVSALPELLIHCLRIVEGLYRDTWRASQEESRSLI